MWVLRFFTEEQAMTESLSEELARLLKARESRLTPEQRKRREEVDERNAAIQAMRSKAMKWGSKA